MRRGDDLKVFKEIGISAEGIEADKVYYYQQGSRPVSWAITRVEPLIINNVKLSLDFSPIDFDNNIQSVLILPLTYGDIFVGVLELCSQSVDSYGPEMIKSLHGLTQNIAMAIRNAGIYHSVQIRRELNDRLQVLIGILSAEMSLDDLLQILLDALEEFFTWDAAVIFLVDQAAFRIKEQSFSETGLDLPQNVNELFNKYFDSTIGEDDMFSVFPWISEVLSSRAPLIRNSPFQYEPLGAILGLDSDYSAIGASLFINEIPIGLIVLAHQLADQYDNEAHSLVSTFANRAAIAIENIRLYAAAHDQAWISTVLLQVADATQSITNLDDLLETVVDMLPRLIGVAACTLSLWDQSMEAFIHRASNGYNDEQMARFDTWEILSGSVAAFDELKQNAKPGYSLIMISIIT